MDTKELLKKVRKIEIKTRRLSDHVFGGEYHSTFKGRGMTFSEVRKYQYGDDVRNIDWNVTARYNDPHIKIFEEERELTMMLIVDVSGSKLFGTEKQLKNEFVTEIAATLAFSATQNNDKIGLILFLVASVIASEILKLSYLICQRVCSTIKMELLTTMPVNIIKPNIVSISID